MDVNILNIRKVRDIAAESNMSPDSVNAEILAKIPDLEFINTSFQHGSNNKGFKCTIEYKHHQKEYIELGTGSTHEEARRKAIQNIVDTLEREQMSDVASANASNDDSTSNDGLNDYRLVYESILGRVIRCSPKSVDKLEYGLYWVNNIEPKDVRSEHIKTLITYEQAQRASKHPWLYILLVFGNNIRNSIELSQEHCYYILCGDKHDKSYLQVAETIEGCNP